MKRDRSPAFVWVVYLLLVIVFLVGVVVLNTQVAPIFDNKTGIPVPLPTASVGTPTSTTSIKYHYGK
jgi:hypothetical protein